MLFRLLAKTFAAGLFAVRLFVPFTLKFSCCVLLNYICRFATIEKGKTCPSLPSSRWQLIKWAKPLLLYMKMVCAHIIGTDHFLFNVAGVVIFFYIVLITIEPV